MQEQIHELDECITRGERVLLELRSLLHEARDAFTYDERRLLASEFRKRCADECSAVKWILLDQLGEVDQDVLDALHELEPDPGTVFRTTLSEIRALCRYGMSPSVVSVALRRLTAIGLIEKNVGRGNAGTLVRVLSPRELKA